MSYEPDNIHNITGEIAEWANSVIPDRTVADTIKKLSMEEVPELWRSLKEDGDIDAGEIADVLILALDICYLTGNDPRRIIEKKMNINRQRNWKFEHGVLQHED